MPMSKSRVQRWEQLTEWPLAILAVVFLVAYAWPILQPDLNASVKAACQIANVVVWIVFAADYVLRLVLADRRWSYFFRHLPDLAMVALPALRPLRLLRLLMLLKALNRRAASSLHGRMVAYVSGSAVVLVFCAALAALDAERGHPGANIESFGNALWWAIVTVSTVGYGDHYPITFSGRLVAVGLMVGGVALLGVVTATFASWLVDRVREVADTEQAATRADIERLSNEIAQLRHLLKTRSETATQR